MISVPVLCPICRHKTPGKLTCAAFPDGEGIPDAILFNEADHREPYPGDLGVRFEPRDKAARKLAATLPAPAKFASSPIESAWEPAP